MAECVFEEGEISLHEAIPYTVLKTVEAILRRAGRCRRVLGGKLTLRSRDALQAEGVWMVSQEGGGARFYRPCQPPGFRLGPLEVPTAV